MKKTAAFLLALLLLLTAGCGPAGESRPALEDVEQTKPGAFSCSFDGVKHRFLLELPEKAKGAPLIVMLPGYGNTAETMRLDTRFDADAVPRGYAVVYVTGAPDPNTPTSSVGWNYEINETGNKDVQFLTALAEYLQREYALDADRAYAVGFSNGAFMIHRLAMEAGDTFTAFVSVAGTMPKSVWDSRRETNAVSFFQITGEKDPVVPKHADGTARTAKSPAIEDVMAYWAASNGLELQGSESVGKASVLTRYAAGDRPQQVWDLRVGDGRHSWPDERIHGFDVNALILDFFEAQKGD